MSMPILPAAAVPLEDAIGAAVRAAQSGSVSELRHLLEVRAVQASDRDSEGCSLLHWAAINGRTDAVALLLAHDADPSAPGGLMNETPMQWAARQGHIDVMAQLLRTGMACAGHKNVEGRDALFLCVVQGNRRGLMLLAANGADVNSSDQEGLSPLLFACKYRPQNLSLIRTLLTLGADPSFQCDALGNSALHLVASQPAGQQGLRDLVRTLRGADRRLCFRRNGEGKDPVSLAKDKGTARLAAYLSRVRVVQRLPPLVVMAAPPVLLATVMSGCSFHGVLGAAVALAFVLSVLLRYHPALTPRQQDCLGLGTTGTCMVCFSAFYLLRLQGRHGGSVLVDALFLSLACLSLYFLSTVRMAHGGPAPSAACPPPAASPREALRCLLLDCKPKLSGAAAGSEDDHGESVDFRRVCDGCFSVKGARSRHCVSCGRCVRRYDHHCSFLSCCIGEENHLDFMVFLLASTLAMALWLVLATQRLLGSSPLASPHASSRRVEAVVLALGALTFVWLSAVTALQLWLIGNEMTMAEYFKHGDAHQPLRGSSAHPLSFKKWARNAVRFFISPPPPSLLAGRAAAAAGSSNSSRPSSSAASSSSHLRASALWPEAVV